MKLVTKVFLLILTLLAIPIIIGFFQPKERLVTEKAIINKMYFFILSDITNHWEEPSWRQNIDTIIQQKVIDGQDAWMEYYTNGDSTLLITQKTTEKDYIRFIVDPSGKDLSRIITLVDYEGKTAIRLSEESYEENPIKRFMLLFKDPTAEKLKQYLHDLKEKNKPSPEGESNNSGW